MEFKQHTWNGGQGRPVAAAQFFEESFPAGHGLEVRRDEVSWVYGAVRDVGPEGWAEFLITAIGGQRSYADHASEGRLRLGICPTACVQLGIRWLSHCKFRYILTTLDGSNHCPMRGLSEEKPDRLFHKTIDPHQTLEHMTFLNMCCTSLKRISFDGWPRI